MTSLDQAPKQNAATECDNRDVSFVYLVYKTQFVNVYSTELQTNITRLYRQASA